MRFCSDRCGRYPCKRLRDLDKRYRTRYGMSMIDNLEFIKSSGIRVFLKKEKERWTCKKCGGTICVHREFCLDCGNKKKI
jgi:ribosomal protein S27AE